MGIMDYKHLANIFSKSFMFIIQGTHVLLWENFEKI